MNPADTKSMGVKRCIIAGTGEKSRESCGELFWVGVCENKGQEREGGVAIHEHVYHHDRCGRLVCPECYAHAAAQRASKQTGRLRAAQKLYEYEYGARHLTISAPPWWEHDTMKGYWKKFAKLWRRVGLKGGCAVLHQYRFSELGSKAYWCSTEAAEGLKKWAWWHLHPKDEYIEWGPHFHVFAYGYVDDVKDFEKETKWVIKVISEVDTSPEHLERAISYVQNHASIEVQRRAITMPDSGSCDMGTRWCQVGQALHWFGSCAPNKLVLVSEQALTSVARCHCGGCLHKHRYVEEEDVLLPWHDASGGLVFVMRIDYERVYGTKTERVAVKTLEDFG